MKSYETSTETENNKNDIKEGRNHFHLFKLAIEDPWCKDESWL